MSEAEKIIKKLKLSAHPEGGYFRETYRSKELARTECLPSEYGSARNFSTSIYFLLKSGQYSAFHKIRQDEIWHFYKGSPVEHHTLSEEGEHTQVIIGNDILNGEVPQYVVPANHWFAAKLIHEEDYCLVGCTVSPGFNFADFELPKREFLLKKFPEHQDLVHNFTYLK